jgi:hypothetical protein
MSFTSSFDFYQGDDGLIQGANIRKKIDIVCD